MFRLSMEALVAGSKTATDESSTTETTERKHESAASGTESSEGTSADESSYSTESVSSCIAAASTPPPSSPRRTEDSQLTASTSSHDSSRPSAPSATETTTTAGAAPPREQKASGAACRVFVMRHGERMDRIFPLWTRLAFDNHLYRPYDLNQPLGLPLRRGGVEAYQSDPPLTEMGQVTVQMVARGMRLRGQQPSVIYCSPALRCVQTAVTMARTVGSPAPCVRVEPGLFEWLAWLGNRGADFLSPAELRDAKLTVDERYQPLMSAAALDKRRHETPAESYERCVSVVQRLLARDEAASTLLLVGHGQTVDAVARALLGKTDTTPLARQQMDRLGFNYPYCATVGVAREGNGSWRLLHDALPSITAGESSNRINHQFFNRV